MYCVPIKTGIKTNPHLFPVHQRQKRAREKKKVERTTARHTCMLSPHHFPYNRGKGCGPGNPDLLLEFVVYSKSLGTRSNPRDPPPKQIPSRSFALCIDRRTTVLIFVQISHGKLKRYIPGSLILVFGSSLRFKAGTGGAMGYTDPGTSNQVPCK